MTTPITAFRAIENGLADKLKATWHKTAFEVFYLVQKAVERRDYNEAVRIARSIDLSHVIKANTPHMHMAAKAGMLFGATRITPKAKQTVISTRSHLHRRVVEDTVRQMQQVIRLNCEERVRDKLLEHIYEADMRDPRTPFTISKAEWLETVKGDFEGHPFRGNQYTDTAAFGPRTTTLPQADEIRDPNHEAGKRSLQDVADSDLPMPVFWKRYDEEELKKVNHALGAYQSAMGEGDAYAVNKALRSGDIPPELQDYVDGIDLAFKRSGGVIIDSETQEPKEAWLYRGVDSRSEFKLKEGDEFIDRGFGSTSTNKSFAEKWAHHKGPGGIVAKITIPAGHKVLNLPTYYGDDDENEVLLNRGTHYRVTKVSGQYVDLQVIA